VERNIFIWFVVTPYILYGHEAMVRLLLEKGADIDVKDRNGWTALD
jgi:ankyrin repeat protein